MITQVVAHVHLLNLIKCIFVSIFGDFHYLSIFVLALNEDILKEVVIVLLGKTNKYNLFHD